MPDTLRVFHANSKQFSINGQRESRRLTRSARNHRTTPAFKGFSRYISPAVARRRDIGGYHGGDIRLDLTARYSRRLRGATEHCKVAGVIQSYFGQKIALRGCLCLLLMSLHRSIVSCGLQRGTICYQGSKRLDDRDGDGTYRCTYDEEGCLGRYPSTPKKV